MQREVREIDAARRERFVGTREQRAVVKAERLVSNRGEDLKELIGAPWPLPLLMCSFVVAG